MKRALQHIGFLFADAALSAASPQPREVIKPWRCLLSGVITNFKLRITKAKAGLQNAKLFHIVIRNFSFVIFTLRLAGFPLLSLPRLAKMYGLCNIEEHSPEFFFQKHLFTS